MSGQTVTDATPTDAEQVELNAEVLREELKRLEHQLAGWIPSLNAANECYQAARGTFEVLKLRVRLARQRMSALQSLLKSIAAF